MLLQIIILDFAQCQNFLKNNNILETDSISIFTRENLVEVLSINGHSLRSALSKSPTGFQRNSDNEQSPKE
jgi:hypothetical protein